MNLEERCKHYFDTYRYYHERVRPPKEDTMFYEVHIVVKWYAIDTTPNWHFSLHAKKVRNGTVHGQLKSADIKCQEAYWEMYMGEKMPHSVMNGEKMVIRTDKVFEYPRHLINFLSSLQHEDCVSAYKENYYKWYLLSDLILGKRSYTADKDEYPYHLDPYIEEKEISKMVLHFETREEIDAWVNRFVDNISKKALREKSLSQIID